jgi:hypothetical protein
LIAVLLDREINVFSTRSLNAPSGEEERAQLSLTSQLQDKNILFEEQNSEDILLYQEDNDYEGNVFEISIPILEYLKC